MHQRPGWQRASGGSSEPAPSRPAGGPAADRHPPAPATTGPILVVDDDPAILATVGEILALEGYDVVLAPDGQAALQRLAELRPALVLLDMRMPVVSGWDVARTLRERGIAVPILAMTAAQDARDWAEQIAADGYLAKPFDLTDLLDAVEQALRR